MYYFRAKVFSNIHKNQTTTNQEVFKASFKTKVNYNPTKVKTTTRVKVNSLKSVSTINRGRKTTQDHIEVEVEAVPVDEIFIINTIKFRYLTSDWEIWDWNKK